MVETVIQIKREITINVGANKKNTERQIYLESCYM